MARYLILIFASLLLILGCTQEETASDKTSTNTEPLVTFLAAANEPTRGKAMSGDLDVTSNFRVYATKQRREGDHVYPNADETIWVNGDVVSYQSIELNPQYHVWVWKTDVDYHWPQDMYFVNFYAVHPESAPVISDILTSKVVNYDGTTHYITGDDDVMWAKIEKTRRYDSNYTSVTDLLGDNCTVNLSFHHLLSQIMFYGKLSTQFKNYGWTVEVGGITIHNLNSAGSFDIATLTTTATTAADYWTAANPAVTTHPYTIHMNTGHQTVSSTTVAKDDAGNDIPLSSPTDVTMVMPQKPNKWDVANTISANNALATPGCYLAISLRVYDQTGYYHLGTADTYTTIYVPFSTGVKNALDAEISWLPNKIYKYTLVFGGGYDAAGQSVLQPMTIETAIKPWNPIMVDGEAKHQQSGN